MIVFLKLFRVDASVLTLVSYLIGAELAGGARLWDVFPALLITCISTNFIYSYNAWADRHIDALNKPWRPIPSGQIKPSTVLLYSRILLALSVVYPFFIAHTPLPLFLFLLLPILGLLYSARPFSFRRHALFSVLTISAGLTTPLMLGYFMNSTETSLIPLFIGLFFYCICVVPLKDIEDAEGDKASGISNLYLSWGNGLPLFSLVLLAGSLLWIFAIKLPQTIKIQMTVVTLGTIICILIFLFFALNTKLLYRTIIRTVIALAIILGIIFH